MGWNDENEKQKVNGMECNVLRFNAQERREATLPLSARAQVQEKLCNLSRTEPFRKLRNGATHLISNTNRAVSGRAVRGKLMAEKHRAWQPAG